MGRRPESHGKCIFCNESFAFSSMTRHFESCEKRKQVLHGENAAKRSKVYGLKVWATYNPAYWLFLEMAHSAKLEDLDHFLRETWLECCNHLSAFMIRDVRYEAGTDEADLFGDGECKTMNIRIGEVFSEGLEAH